MFLIYINDLPYCKYLKKHFAMQFADDSNMFITGIKSI